MKKRTFTFSNSRVNYYFDAEFAYIDKFFTKEKSFIITDENVYAAHKKKFKDRKTIVGVQHSF